MAELDISIISNVSISATPATLGFYNPNSLMIISSDEPLGVLGYTTFGIYNNLSDVGTDWGTTTNTYKMAQMVFAQSPNILSAGGYLIIAPLQESEKVDVAITRLYSDVYFAGVMTTQILSKEDAISASTTAQGLDTILFLSSSTATDMDSGNVYAEIAEASNTHTKPTYYGMDGTVGALKFTAGLASRAMCVDFTAQNSTNTLNLKDIAGLTADTTITSSISGKATTSGVDIYPSIGGLAKVLSNPIANLYLDSVYNQIWFKKRVQVSFFNALAGTRNKIPQTEVGMNYLKNSVREVCALAVYNGFLAPNKWNSADTFGNPDDFRRNIEEFGYYVYSIPVSQQSQTDRQARKAPVIQVAGKEAGAVHSGNIILIFEQ